MATQKKATQAPDKLKVKKKILVPVRPKSFGDYKKPTSTTTTATKTKAPAATKTKAPDKLKVKKKILVPIRPKDF